MAETHGVVVESRTFTVDTQQETSLSAGDASHGPTHSSAKPQLDDDPQTQSVSLRIVKPADHVDDFQTPLADGENGEQGESLLKIAFHSLSVFFSAGFYLFDFVSNVLVLKLYWQEVYQQGKFEGSTRGSIRNELTPFVTCLCLLLSTQIIAVLTFKLKLPPEECPLRSACLLPLVQAHRLVKELRRWKTAKRRNSRGSSQRWEASETESLFAIMSALETSLQIPLQISYSALTGQGDRQWRPSRELVLSIVASFLSGAYNAGLAIMYNTSLRWGFLLNALGIAGGLYTLGSLVLRSMAIAQVALASEVSGIHHLILLGIYFGLCAPAFYWFGLISSGKYGGQFSGGVQLRAALATFYVLLGPVYPVLEGFATNITSISLKVNTVVRLLVVVTLNVFLDVSTFIFFAKMNWGICRYSKKRIDFPDRPYLSSTLKCSRFIQLTSFGAALSIVSALALGYFLLSPVLHGSNVSVILGIRKVMSPGLNQASSDSLSDDQQSLSSGSRRHQPSSGKIIIPASTITRTNFRKFSSRIANFDGKDFENSRMVLTNSATKQFAVCLDLRDVESLTSEEVGSPNETLKMLELVRLKASYCSLRNAESCCKNSLQSRNTLQKLRNAENAADFDLKVKSEMAESAPDSDVAWWEAKFEQTPTTEDSATMRCIQSTAEVTIEKVFNLISKNLRNEESELVDRTDAKAARTPVNDGIELTDGFPLPGSSNEKLTETNGVHEFGKCELIRKRNLESNGDNEGDADGRFVPVAKAKEHGWSISKTLRDGRTKRTIIGRSISAGTGEKSCANDNIVKLTSISLGSSTSFRKLLGKGKPDAKLSIFGKKNA